MINTTHELFTLAIDQITQGGRGTIARAISNALSKHSGDETPLARAIAAVGRGSHAINTGRYEEGLHLIIPALEELERSAFSKRLGWLHSQVGFAVGMMGNPERGLEWTAKGISAIDVTPASVDRFVAYGNHGCLLGMVGEHDASNEVLERALRIAVETKQQGSQYIALLNIAYGLLVQLQERDLLSAAQKKSLANRALKHVERAKKLGPGGDIGLDPAAMDSLLGQAMLHAGDVTGAKEKFTQALHQGHGNPSVSVDIHLGMAIAQRLSEQYDDARTHMEMAEQIATKAQLGLVLDRVLTQGVLLETAAGNVSAALDWATRRCHFLEKHYKQRLRLVARSTELASQAGSVSQSASQYQQEADILRLQTDNWDDERLRDPLTQALSRKGLARIANHVYERVRQFAMVVIDIDHFTMINETYGRDTGDTLLQQVATTIASYMRSADQFARTEGAEYQLLLLDTSPVAAFETCEQIRCAIERKPWISKHPEARITVSIGICNRSSEKSFEAILAAADRALDQAKKAGRNKTYDAAWREVKFGKSAWPALEP